MSYQSYKGTKFFVFRVALLKSNQRILEFTANRYDVMEKREKKRRKVTEKREYIQMREWEGVRRSREFRVAL